MPRSAIPLESVRTEEGRAIVSVTQRTEISNSSIVRRAADRLESKNAGESFRLMVAKRNFLGPLVHMACVNVSPSQDGPAAEERPRRRRRRSLPNFGEGDAEYGERAPPGEGGADLGGVRGPGEGGGSRGGGERGDCGGEPGGDTRGAHSRQTSVEDSFPNGSADDRASRLWEKERIPPRGSAPVEVAPV